ncbi:MAG TPA: type I-C CRISPR-associated endonuclease Cas1c [Denitromonas sp.]|uniref:type I-C CRISPR-associated endonuclease Cas1c n=1 Tax=Denitromonas sp. TaxID=2734609 RepID=UPI001D601F40|nr:type I-C CRISPR-associated endonuclease Cas1 [Rhodocyclaceae bacterium]MCP5222292.1 type I-C CRISPR-associated endonuclease Cas1 [Zoogloeaceae bacterium]HPR08515.1 type I-C CRISPR-associated endonuclease Cas1c [Denitromonas sp.]HQU88478.1 type I-C CRISPR-associated endonuclease Cas1c [Denitromonas sp.]HQV14582.1 type I-C CRISPR-associated endonuclease Cas1c [Denitromonas sp.]
MQLLNTLYVTTPDSYLHLDNDTLRVEVDHDTRLRVPLHHLGAIVCLGNIRLSTPLMHRVADDGISLVMLDANGRFKARLEGPVSGNVLLRSAQFDKASDPDFTLNVARNFVAGKVRNSRQVLLRGARESKNGAEAEQITRAANNLAATLRTLPSATDLDTLRGLEGDAARQYFGALNLLLREDMRDAFQMNGRSRRPPRDRFNAVLSFLYSMLMNDCRSAIEAAGLDPQVGFLHALRPGRAALALDLMEEFRHLADRLALTLINRGQINADDFDHREGGAVMLEGDARKTVVTAWQERKQEQITHALLAQPVAIGLIPLVQARLLARTLRGETTDYPPYLTR